MKKNGFAPLILILVIAILGVLGYFAYNNTQQKPQNTVLDNSDQLMTYKNDSFEVEFQYDRGSKVTYEVKNGDAFIDGVDKGPYNKGSFVIVTLDDKSLAVNVDGKEMEGDVQYFGLEAIPNDGVNRGNIDNNCDEGASKETKAIVNKYGIKLWLTDYSGQYEQRVACLKHGKYIWTLSTHFVYPANKDKIIRLFDLIANSFKFTK